jgi:Holliday junction resolvase
MMGFTVWRQNNLAVRGRKFIGKKGMPDIIGYDNQGCAVWCEVKTINDKLSQHQVDFMADAMNAGCKVFICMQHKELNVKFISWRHFVDALINGQPNIS